MTKEIMKDKVIEFNGNWNGEGLRIIDIPFPEVISKILPELRKEAENWDKHNYLIVVKAYLTYLEEKYCSKKKLK